MDTKQMITTKIPPTFTRQEVAHLLQCAPLTIANREKKGVYPPAKRDYKEHRYYVLADVFELMYITDKQIYLKPIVAVMHDKGYTDIKDLESYLTKEYNIFFDKLATNPKVTDEQSAGDS